MFHNAHDIYKLISVQKCPPETTQQFTYMYLWLSKQQPSSAGPEPPAKML